MLARIVAMLTRLINRFDRDEPPMRKGLAFPLLFVLVIDSLDFSKNHPPLPSFTFSHSDPLLTSNGQSSITSTRTRTSTIMGAR
jgi:hypothetical protein